ncbi:MAG: NAD(P)/FAD-dependent oxidoreductase [Thermoplasmatota archaeon]
MHDVIVVGGGPSGSHAAYCCALRGLSTLLIEKERYPRDKPCGGAVDASLRERIGPGLDPTIEARTNRARLFYNFQELGQLRYENLYVSRMGFDEMMARRAEARGALVLEGVKAKKVLVTDAGAEVVCSSGSHRARMVIGADGVASVVRWSSGLNAQRVRPDRYLAAALELEAPDKLKGELLGDREDRRFYNVYFFGGFIGLGWVFPKLGGLNIGLGGFSGVAAESRLRLPQFLKRLGMPPSLARAARWYPIPSRPLRQIYSKRVLLVGDAAGFVNPFSGAGIDMGMDSAELAAEVCRQACELGKFSGGTLRRYQELCEPLLRRLRAKARLVSLARFFLERGLYSDASMRFFVRRLAPLAQERGGAQVSA